MNYLKTALRVKFNLTNPYQIKPQYKLLSSQDPFNPTLTTLPSKLIAKDKIDNDYYILRFSLPEQNKCLGINIGQYIWIELKDKNKRPYVPISRIDQTGFVDILVRDMSVINKGSFTQKLLNLSMQSDVNIVGPGTQFIYQGYGKFKYINPQLDSSQTDDTKNIPSPHPYYPHPPTSSQSKTANSQKITHSTQKSIQVTPISKTFKNIGIITHSSAITTTYSLIQSIATNYDNNTGVSLLWLGDKQSDFIFVNQFTSYVERYKLNMNLMLAGMNQIGKSTKNWLGPYGRVMQKHIQQFMPFPNSKQIILMSGLQGELAEIPNLIKKMGYKDYLNF